MRGYVQRTYVPLRLRGHALRRQIPTIMYLIRGLAYEASCFWSTMGIRTQGYGIADPGEMLLTISGCGCGGICAVDTWVSVFIDDVLVMFWIVCMGSREYSLHTDSYSVP